MMSRYRDTCDRLPGMAKGQGTCDSSALLPPPSGISREDSALTHSTNTPTKTEYVVSIPDDQLRATLDAIWFAAHQREKMTTEHQQLLHDVGKQIRQQELDRRYLERHPTALNQAFPAMTALRDTMDGLTIRGDQS